MRRKAVFPYCALGNYLVWGLVLTMGFIWAFVKLARELMKDELGVFDQTVIDLVHSLAGPTVTKIMKAITTLGSSIMMIFLALVVLFYLLVIRRHTWDSLMTVVVLLGSWLMNELLKQIFHRPRPFASPLVQVTGFSFPSGHAMVSLAFYGMLAYLMWLNIPNKAAKYGFTLFFILLVLAIGFSRIYLGVHFPSDILAGYAGGGFWLTGCILGLRTIRYYQAGL